MHAYSRRSTRDYAVNLEIRRSYVGNGALIIKPNFKIYASMNKPQTHLPCLSSSNTSHSQPGAPLATYDWYLISRVTLFATFAAHLFNLADTPLILHSLISARAFLNSFFIFLHPLFVTYHNYIYLLCIKKETLQYFTYNSCHLK